MPCRYYTEGEERTMAIQSAREAKEKAIQYKADLDRLTAENDMLREFALAVANGEKPKLPKSIKKEIEAEQIKHRKEDLVRLEAIFREDRNPEALGLVLLADPTKPLKPQLGFDPDDF